MNRDSQLKLQAYLDGELEAAQAPQIAEWLAKDSAAQTLFGELMNTRTLLSGNELSPQLPATREFFWSRIEPEIARLDSPGSTSNGWRSIFWWWRILVPVGAVGLLVVTLLPMGDPSPAKTSPVAALKGIEVETFFPDTQVITYRSEAQGVSVVWVNTQ